MADTQTDTSLVSAAEAEAGKAFGRVSFPKGFVAGGHIEPPLAPARYRFRGVSRRDGPAMLDIVDATGLDRNSPYCYLMLGEYFAETCVLAERGGTPVGFVAAFLKPEEPDTAFVWQIGVRASERGQGLGKKLLHELLERPACDMVTYLEATVTPSNRASRSLFRSFARDLGVRCAVRPCFTRELFPGGHEPEELFRIGPFDNS